ncbi:hypothetical protein C2845_PM03G11550 [Panicum miliaceum]|uniref:C2 domain-containing protein n=1 Tax=Panicum miliaceum TaxID=4540 RepID=A0A3L6TG07_PANMI|nr:hypothetical protein C2845_PM03G11550 [Panicum miliaceum]
MFLGGWLAPFRKENFAPITSFIAASECDLSDGAGDGINSRLMPTQLGAASVPKSLQLAVWAFLLFGAATCAHACQGCDDDDDSIGADRSLSMPVLERIRLIRVRKWRGRPAALTEPVGQPVRVGGISSLFKKLADLGWRLGRTGGVECGLAMEQQKGGAVTALAAAATGTGELIGYVDVHVRSARDIQNICIYHKQDVYARVSLPGDGAPVASTQVVNGGGRNPVFDQSLRLGVRAGDVDAALRCEVWMLSRVKNYLQDQLLGFALVPLPEVVAADGGTLAREFPLTTSDLFQTPSGFLQLELSYIGVVPEENQIMVSEYTGLPCAAVEAQSSESLLTSEHENGATTLSHEAGVRLVESFSTDHSTADSVGGFRSDTPVSSVSTTESPASAAVPATPQSNSSSEPSGNAHSSAGHKEKAAPEAADAEVDSSRTEVKVDGNQIMDMYMKSMQQFTDSLARMKLPALDLNNGSSEKSSPAAAASEADSSGADSSAAKKPTAGGQQEKPSPKVFYGSRAFF